MNDVFEFKRFGLLFKKTILERPVQLIGLTGLTLGVTLILYSAFLYFTDGRGWNLAQNLSFVYGFVGGGCFLSSVVFGYFGTNASGSAYLTLPASAFEKWLCGIIISGILFTCIFLIFYRVIDTCFVTSYHNGLDKNSPQYKTMYDAVQIYPFDIHSNIIRQSLVMYANFVGAMMLGSLYFNKVSAIKTALVYCCLLAVIFLFNSLLVHMMFANVDFAFPFNVVSIKVGSSIGIIELPAVASGIVFTVAQFIIPGILWLTTYIRLREKEI